jgi:hypothetical protein
VTWDSVCSRLMFFQPRAGDEFLAGTRFTLYQDRRHAASNFCDARL